MTDRTLRPSRAIFAAMMMLAAMILAGLSTRASAQAFENLDRLDSLVAMSIGANRGEPGGPIAPIDRRLRLAPCPTTPTVDGPQMGAAVVSCPSVGWRIRVPLVASAPAAKAQISAVSVAASPSVVVKKGDPVQLIAGDTNFSVSRMMVAEEDGAVGAMIRVRQDKSTAPVIARVEGMGLVRAPGI